MSVTISTELYEALLDVLARAELYSERRAGSLVNPQFHEMVQRAKELHRESVSTRSARTAPSAYGVLPEMRSDLASERPPRDTGQAEGPTQSDASLLRIGDDGLPREVQGPDKSPEVA